jgi:hypothetical protein
MKTSSLSIREQKALVASGEVTLTPRKTALLYRSTEALDITGPILSAAGCGAGIRLAAGQGGLTESELRYVLDLGAAGHPAYREFHDEYLRRSTEPGVLVAKSLLEDAVDPEKRTLAHQKLALRVTAPELVAEDRGVEKDQPAVQTQHFVVNIQDKFETVPVVRGDVEDAEFEEER